MAANSPEIWFKNLPLVTKSYLCAGVVTTALVTFGSITPLQIYLDFSLVFKKFQLWRLITNFFFFGKFSLKFMFQMFILQSYTSKLETGRFRTNRGRAEMIHMFMFGAVFLLLISYLMGGQPFLGKPLIFMNLYVWSRGWSHVKGSPRIIHLTEVDFWGFTFKAWQLPYVLLLVGMLMGGSPIHDIMGIFVGHLYHFCVDIVPEVYRLYPVECPDFLYNYFDPPNRQVVRETGRWGTGYSLQ